MKKDKQKVDLPKSIFLVLNPEGKAFHDSVSYNQRACEQEFCKSWFAGWGIVPTGYESDVMFRMFERAGFKMIEVPLPMTLEP